MSRELTAPSLAALAMGFPGAMEVLRELGLDFCCRGERPLDEGCADMGIEPWQVAEALAHSEDPVAPAPFDDLPALPLPTLAAFVQSHYHANLRLLLVEVVALVDDVEAHYPDRQTGPGALLERVRTGAAELVLHMWREELLLSEMVRRGARPRLAGMANAMRREHLRHGAFLDELRTLTRGFSPPEGASGAWVRLYVVLADLERQLQEHILVENELVRRVCESWA